jgi:hypothetical protein
MPEANKFTIEHARQLSQQAYDDAATNSKFDVIEAFAKLLWQVRNGAIAEVETKRLISSRAPSELVRVDNETYIKRELITGVLLDYTSQSGTQKPCRVVWGVDNSTIWIDEEDMHLLLVEMAGLRPV